MRRFRIAASLIALAVAATMPVGAASDASLRSVRGVVGYQTAKDAAFTRVFGSYLVGDDQFAVTQAASNGLLLLADSSQVALGAATTIQVGQITAAAAGAPTAITLVAGTLRFNVKHPAGGQSNYRFQTSTSQIAVRGTIGLYSTGPNGDVISCVECSAGDVSVSTATQTITLVTGQTATISVTGAVVVGATTAAVAGTFSGAGLSTTTSVSSFAPGISAGVSGAAGASTAAVAAGAGAAAAAGVAAAASSHSSPAPVPVPLVIASPTPAPVQGSATISGHARAPFAAAPLPAVPAPAVAPVPAHAGLPLPGRR